MSQADYEAAYKEAIHKLNPIPSDDEDAFKYMFNDKYPEFVNQCILLNEACLELNRVNDSENIYDHMLEIKNHIFRTHCGVSLRRNIQYAQNWVQHLRKEIPQPSVDESLILIQIEQALNEIQLMANHI